MFRPGMIIVLTLLAMPAGAEIYKWTDARGQVHYGDHPPSSTLPDPFTPHTSQATEARAVDARRQAADLAARKRLEDTQAREAEAKARALRAEETQRKTENCQRARGNLELLQRAHMRLSTVDSTGNTRMLDATERQVEVERANKMISENCAN